MRNILIFLALLLSAACTPFAYSPAPPTPEHISVVYTPALIWMGDDLNRCALEHPEISLTVEERSAASLQVEAAAATLTLDTIPEGFSGTTTQLGWEQVVIIANTDISSTQLELPDLQNLYKSLAPEYQAWSYPTSSELQKLFSKIILNGIEQSPHTKIAPNPQAMLTALEGSSQAVGFIPISLFSTRNIQIIPMPIEIESALNLPVLALTTGEPSGATRLFLGCLTDSLKLD
ncbi:MAG: hypothetical protein ISR58_07225 [Anaerolineales bacterium]|nr:hypothetical protein [Chloroflexota bacterium]MBL6980967.1 hypothetical protein [Anaerolineales bacterium]